MGLIDQITSSNAWSQVMKEFQTLSPEDYSMNRAGTCKKMVSLLTSTVNPNLLIPAHPEGSDNQNAWHSYSVIRSETKKPEDDIIVDLTVGQIIPDIAPFIGTRSELHAQIELAYTQGRINPEFMEWFAEEMSKEGKNADSERIFENFYGHASLNAFSNEPLHEERKNTHMNGGGQISVSVDVDPPQEDLMTLLVMQKIQGR
ncbi:MAG: hypothetical protein ACK59C_03095 [Holosporales bacterium]|jgi:hypothetical protein